MLDQVPADYVSVTDLAIELGRSTTEVAEALQGCVANSEVDAKPLVINVDGVNQKVMHFAKVDSIKKEAVAKKA